MRIWEEARVVLDITAIDENPLGNFHARQIKVAEPDLDEIINLMYGKRFRPSPAPQLGDIDSERPPRSHSAVPNKGRKLAIEGDIASRTGFRYPLELPVSV
jgi:hypothetical protein